jgi:hypothetical protein
MASGRVSKVKGKVLDIPTVPTIGTATAGGESATVEFTASTKGGPVSTYTALSNPGSVTTSGTSSPITVSGLTAGTAYTFTVRGNNVTGSSEYSSASNSVTPIEATAFESIATVTVGATSVASITLSSIPGTYKHLQLRYISQNTSSDTTVFRVNSDSGNNYSLHVLSGDGSTIVSGGTASYSYGSFGITSGGTSNNFAAGIVDILDYANSNKYKTFKSLSGRDFNGSGGVQLRSSLWQTTSTITSITVTTDSGFNFTQYTQFALYGIKGA